MNVVNDLKLQYRMGGLAQKLIFWNVGLFAIPFLVNMICNYVFKIDFNLFWWISVSSSPMDLLYKPWSLITYAFFHAGFFHIFFNMLVFNFASGLFLTYFSQRQLFSLYLLAAIFAAIVYIICYFVCPSLRQFQTTMVGASAAVMAIFIAIATYAPLMQVRLMFIGNVKLWHIAFVYIIIDLIQLPLENTGGHIAHLAGAFFGFVYIKQMAAGRNIGEWFSKFLDAIGNLSFAKSKTPFKKVYKNNTEDLRKDHSKSTSKNITQQQIDDILDKIGKSGYDSLSNEEKQFLFNSAK
jgi:membrane associated rhomboid family serine protease